MDAFPDAEEVLPWNDDAQGWIRAGKDKRETDVPGASQLNCIGSREYIESWILNFVTITAAVTFDVYEAKEVIKKYTLNCSRHSRSSPMMTSFHCRIETFIA